MTTSPRSLATRIHPPLGSTRHELDTPCLVIDLDALERNITRLSEFCRKYNIAWRPHAKSYKCGQLALLVVKAGAVGVTCAKLGEAEMMAAAGVTDLLITSPLVGEKKLSRLVELRRHADPIVVVDDLAQAQAISAAAVLGDVTIRMLMEIELGLNRCGVEPGEAALQLARQIVALPGIELAGIMGWEGHLLTIADLQEKTTKITAAIKLLDETKRLLVDAGLPCPIVSAGGTGSFQVTGTLGVINELQAGGAIFMDLFYRNQCQVVDMEYSLTILASVMSRPTPTRAVIDAGRKTMSPDLHLPHVKGRDDLQTKWLSAEHGIMEVVAAPGPAVGDRVELIPGYGDWTTVLHDRFYVFRGDRLEAIWELDARGRSE